MKKIGKAIKSNNIVSFAKAQKLFRTVTISTESHLEFILTSSYDSPEC